MLTNQASQVACEHPHEAKMYSLLTSWRRGFKQGDIPEEEYEWSQSLFSEKIGTRRIETKRFVRFERLTVKPVKNGYKYLRRTSWFLNFPFCRNDEQLWIANIVGLFIASCLLLNIVNCVLVVMF